MVDEHARRARTDAADPRRTPRKVEQHRVAASRADSHNKGLPPDSTKMGRGDAPTLEVVDEYDADGDGRVTREEYLAGFLRDGIRPVRQSNSRGAS